ncbi:MAG: GHKL domain-containing protein [Firmicutes bacterium]|nr:GHKL domain-containing protein [Bacillota bacterium]
MRSNYYERIILSIGVLGLVSLLWGTALNYFRSWESTFVLAIVLATVLTILIAICVTFYLNTAYQGRLYQDQIEKNELQKMAIETLREQRHDILNDLALISSYLQLQRYKEAQNYLELTAASLSDKYNIIDLPYDAWLTLIRIKQEEAEKRDIILNISMDAPSPADINERRLLPKLTANLLDNAFDAVCGVPSPYVELRWYMKDDCRVLSVENNGPEIDPDIMSKVWKPGYSSKKRDGAGWGLAICKKIAEELGGDLVLTSTKGKTNFSLFLYG